MDLTLQQVLVASGEDCEGVLVFREGYLVAVLVRLSAMHDESAGEWFLEKGFAGLDGPQHPSFPDLDAACDWIKARLADSSSGDPWR